MKTSNRFKKYKKLNIIIRQQVSQTESDLYNKRSWTQEKCGANFRNYQEIMGIWGKPQPLTEPSCIA